MRLAKPRRPAMSGVGVDVGWQLPQCSADGSRNWDCPCGDRFEHVWGTLKMCSPHGQARPLLVTDLESFLAWKKQLFTAVFSRAPLSCRASKSD